MGKQPLDFVTIKWDTKNRWLEFLWYLQDSIQKHYPGFAKEKNLWVGTTDQEALNCLQYVILSNLYAYVTIFEYKPCTFKICLVPKTEVDSPDNNVNDAWVKALALQFYTKLKAELSCNLTHDIM